MEASFVSARRSSPYRLARGLNASAFVCVSSHLAERGAIYCRREFRGISELQSLVAHHVRWLSERRRSPLSLPAGERGDPNLLHSDASHAFCTPGAAVSDPRQLALRLALYLECGGVTPITTGNSYEQYCIALNNQLMSLEPELRKRGRREGRRLIRETPGLDKAAGHLVPIFSPTPPLSPNSDMRSERRKRRMMLWLAKTKTCPVCRMWGGYPKKWWGSFEIADAVRRRQGDPDLRVYQCSARPEYFHLGHVRVRRESLPVSDRISS
jgi:hypothetical protein